MKAVCHFLKRTSTLGFESLFQNMQYQEVYSFYRIQVQCTFGQNIHDICIVNEVKDSLDPCNS